MGKRFHKIYMSAPNLETFNERIQNHVDSLPPNATIESVNYESGSTVLNDMLMVSASVLIIYSTPMD